MKTPLTKIEILSIYERNGEKVLLPERMALCAPDVLLAVKGISRDLKEKKGKLYLSDLFRSYDMQLQAYLDWKTKKKKAYSPPPGGSLHEAGRAFDLALKGLRISLREFWELAAKWGVVPIINEPDPRKSEAWHFDCRASHQIVYDYYKKGNAQNMKPYKAMAVSGILSIGVNVEKFGQNQKEAYLQSCLIRLGLKLGNIDGIAGKKTKKALAELGISELNIDTALTQIEDKLQEKFPAEFGVCRVDKELFDYDVPDHVVG